MTPRSARRSIGCLRSWKTSSERLCMSERGQQEYARHARGHRPHSDLYVRDHVRSVSRGSQDARARAVIRNIEILGEAAKHVPATLTRAYPEIEWKSIAGSPRRGNRSRGLGN